MNEFPQYPNVTRGETLAEFLRSQISATLPTVTIEGFNEMYPGGSSYWASISAGERHSEMTLAGEIYIHPFWENHVALAHFKTRSISVLINIIDLWYVKKLRVSEICKHNPDVRAEECMPYYEEGPEEYTKYCWLKIEKRIRTAIPELLPVFVSVAELPLFRKLIPLTSHDRLFFIDGPFCESQNSYPLFQSNSDIEYEVIDFVDRKETVVITGPLPICIERYIEFIKESYPSSH